MIGHRHQRVVLLAALVLPVAAACSTSPASSGTSGPSTATVTTAPKVSVTTLAFGQDEKQRVDVFRPAGHEEGGGSGSGSGGGGGDAVVVYLHGGVWQHGDRRQYQHVGAGLAAHGVETMVASYRLAPDHRWPAQIEDAAAVVALAVDAARRHHPARPVIVVGHSAGAQLAMLLVSQPRWLAAHGHSPADVDGVVNISGVFDLEAPLDEAQADGGRAAFIAPVFADADVVEASPIHLPVPDDVRLLFITGPEDYRAMQAQTTAARQALAARGRQTPLVVIPDRNHFQLVEGLGGDDDPVTVAVMGFVRPRP